MEIDTWLKDKSCKKCSSDNVYAVLSNKKIVRYGLYCKICNRFIAWIPKKYAHEAPILERRSEHHDPTPTK